MHFKLVDLLKFARLNSATDIFLKNNSPPYIGVFGRVHEVDMRPLTNNVISEAIYSTLNPVQQEKYKEPNEKIELVFSTELNSVGRFRVAIYKQIDGLSASIRLILENEKLETMPIYQNLGSYIEDSGLVILAGNQGSGRSTIASAIVHYLNKKYAKHILTFEDPIEIMHKNIHSVVDQREKWTNYEDEAFAISSSRFKAADVIYVDYLSSYHITEMLMQYSAQGMLVIAPFFSKDIPSVLSRIINTFPAPDRNSAQAYLADVLSIIIIQDISWINDAPYFKCRVFKNDMSAREHIREGNFNNLYTLEIHNDICDVPIETLTNAHFEANDHIS